MTPLAVTMDTVRSKLARLYPHVFQDIPGHDGTDRACVKDVVRSSPCVRPCVTRSRGITVGALSGGHIAG